MARRPETDKGETPSRVLDPLHHLERDHVDRVGTENPTTYSRLPDSGKKPRVYRTAGTTAALITLFVDILKGLVPVWLAQTMGLSVNWQIAVAIAALLGHCYPLYFKFRGGKGVATAFGGLIILHTSIGLSLLAVWLATFVISRTSSVAAIVAGLTVPLSTFYVLPEAILPLSAMALIVIWRHHNNIIKLIQGDENKFKD